ncbi:hypothetical protein QJS04_geneDACA001720 [Acorus gramineus]|uniref:Heptahelical transmembrane protein 4-like n=1 Tax=Acorus gramineus TaxID=55184 RepID=A0AAV9BFY3_ACOGR|nr:hypothetical protein QJS04_geneDACA001720 [Acorus gramineus]
MSKREDKNLVSFPYRGKRKMLWKKGKCHLIEYDSLPNYLKDNEFIINYYRSEWPLKETIFSIFSVHNETLNVWTHLFGFLIFLALTLFTSTNVPLTQIMETDLQKMQLDFMSHLPFKPNTSSHLRLLGESSTKDKLPSTISRQLSGSLANCSPERYSLTNYSDRCVLVQLSPEEDAASTMLLARLTVNSMNKWPFYAFLFGAMFCLLTSSACHLLSCHSRRFSYIMLRLDYAGISALIVTSFYPLVYYSFMCHPFFRNLYIGFITSFGVTIVLVLLVPIFQTPEFRLVRAGLFFCMGVSGLVPILHKLIMFCDRPEALESTGYELLMGFLYGVGVVIYATRVPERWLPGKFDLVGHSHQWFHVLVIAGAYAHYHAGLVYLKWRDYEGC